MQRFLILIRKLAAYGQPSTVGADLSQPLQARHSWHAISNQIWLWNILLTATIIPLVLVLIVLFGDLVAGQRLLYLISYCAIPAAILAVQVGLFVWGNRLSLNGRTVTLHLLIGSNCIMLWLFSFCIGPGGGVHYLFAAAMPLPFYFFRSDLHRVARYIKIAWVFLVLGQFILAWFLLPQFAAWWPLSAVVERIVHTVLLFIALIISGLYFIYLWWQLQLTGRFLAYWDKISYHNMPLDFAVEQREWHSFTNRIAYLSLGYWLVTYGGALTFGFGQLLYYREPAPFVLSALKILLPHLLVSLLVAFAATRFVTSPYFYRQNIFFKHVFFMILLIVNCFLWLWGGFIFPVAIPFSLFSFYATVFSILMRDSRFYLSTIAVLLVSLFAGGYGLFIQITHPPLYPVPGYTMVWASPYTIAAFVAGFIIILFYSRFESDKAKSALNHEREKNAELHRQSEKLLLNILPGLIADELKAKGTAEPQHFDAVTVLFTDFVGFTSITEKLSPTELVSELDRCFRYFDHVAEKFGLEKLKTIGDAYMAAGGIPVKNFTHTFDCALAALELTAFIEETKNSREKQGLPYWELRLGVHTGPLVAGVVGDKKFAYDVWGDTVNVASRMESSGAAGEINISQQMYEQIKFLFDCEYRGKVPAKNKGEIEMYFLRGLKPKYSVSGLGRVPNAAFKDLYEKIKNGAKLVAKE